MAKSKAAKISKSAPAPAPAPNPTLDNKILAVLAANLRALRKAKGWSQADLAGRTNVHVTHVSRVELGMYMPSLEFALNAATALGVNVEALITPADQAIADVRVEDLEMSQRLRLLDLLDKRDRDALFIVIDAFLTKHRIRQFLNDNPPASSLP
jgi:transcriptional regulator with XRE-family HTH domain